MSQTDSARTGSSSDSENDLQEATAERLLAWQSIRWRSGKPVPVRRILAKSALAQDDVEVVLDLIQNEVVLRRECDEVPQLDEYEAEFPHLARALRIQWELNRFLGADDDTRHASEVPTVHDGTVAPGGRVGRFDIQQPLGHGGMGIAFRAWDPVLKRVVVVKRLHVGKYANQIERQRFQIEAEAVARVRHVNVVQIYDVGESDGEPFIAIEYCDGGTLADRLRDGPLAPTDAARVVLQIAQGVAAAHVSNVIHRDLKPANIFFTNAKHCATRNSSSNSSAGEDALGEPIVKVSDFGLARLADAEEHHTKTGTVLGTVNYMAPEQAMGRAGGVGPAADIYSIGAILFECLTGKPPFHGATFASTLHQIQHSDPISTRSSCSAVPVDLDTIATVCLQKDERRRYANAAALVDDLNRFLEGKTILARRVGMVELSMRWCRRNPVLASLYGLVLSLLVVLAVVMAISNVRLSRALSDASDNARRANTAEREARRSEADALIGQAHSTRLSRRDGKRFASLQAIARAVAIGKELKLPDEWFDPIRNEAAAALALPDLFITDRLPAKNDLSRVAAAPELDKYAYADRNGNLSVRDIPHDRELWSIAEKGQITYLRFSPDGRFLAAVHTPTDGVSRAFVVDLAKKPPSITLDVPAAVTCGFLAGTTEPELVCAHHLGELSVWDLVNGTRSASLSGIVPQQEPRLEPHPCLPMIALFTPHSNRLTIHEAKSGRTIARTDVGFPSGINDVAWHPTGNLIGVSAVGISPKLVYHLDVDAGEFRFQQSLGAEGGATLEFDLDGRNLYSTGWGIALTAHVLPGGQMNLQTTAGVLPEGRESFVVNSAKNKVAFMRDPDSPESLCIASVANGREYRRIGSANVGPGFLAGRFAIHPQGRLIAQSSADGFRLFDLRSGQELHRQHDRSNVPDFHFAIAFDDSGRLYTNNISGTLRWPIHVDDGVTLTYRLGTPDRLPFHSGNRGIAVCPDGRILAQAMYNDANMAPYAGGWLLRDGESFARHTGTREYQYCSVSPDGRWAAFCSHVGIGVKPCDLIDVATGQVVWTSPQEAGNCRFTRNGKWLLVGATRVHAYEVGTWREARDLGPGHLSEASWDGELASIWIAPSTHRIVEIDSGRELVRLEAPEDNLWDSAFTPDGQALIVRTNDGMRVWDLASIRAQLAELGLEWNSKPSPTLSKSDRTESSIIRLVVDPEIEFSGRETHNQSRRAELANLADKISAWRLKLGQTAPGTAERLELRRLHWRRAAILVELGENQESLSDYLQAVDLQVAKDVDGKAIVHRRDQVPLLFQYAMAMRRSGRTEEADTVFNQTVQWREELVRDDDKSQTDAELLAIIYGDLCFENLSPRNMRRPSEVIKWAARAIEQWERVRQDWPNSRWQGFRSYAYGYRAMARTALGELDAALVDWERAEGAATPDRPFAFQAERALTRAKAGIEDLAVKEAMELAATSAGDAERLYSLALVYAALSRHASQHQPEWRQRALESLEKALRAGYAAASHVADDPDWAPLADDPDFQRLVR